MKKEYDTIKQILYNNKYDVNILDRMKAHKEAKTKTKWAKFTYIRRQTKFITKLFKNF
jgi:hypothetical protein